MIHSPNHSATGFVIIEIVLTLAMMGIIITALFGLQSSLMTGTMEASDQVRRIIHLRNTFFEYELQHPVSPTEDVQPQSFKHAIDDPPTQITRTTKKISEESSLKQFKNVKRVVVQGTWERAGQPEEITLVSFVYKKPKKKKKS